MINATHPEVPRPQPVASWRHTAQLVVLFLALAAIGLVVQRQAVRSGAPQLHPNVVPLYLSLLAAEWGLFLYVWRGTRRTGTTLRELVGGRWASPRDLLVDSGLALGAWAVFKILSAAWWHWLKPHPAASIDPLLPRRPIEVLLWIVLSVSAGICEELAFRGYFQRQFAAKTGSPWLAVGLQALLFGIAHSYQGLEATCWIAVYGALFGLLALFRKSLRPGMIAHALTDLLSGLFGI